MLFSQKKKKKNALYFLLYLHTRFQLNIFVNFFSFFLSFNATKALKTFAKMKTKANCVKPQYGKTKTAVILY